MKHYLLFLGTFLVVFPFWAQKNLDLETCYQQLELNYPLAKQKQMFTNQNNLDLKAIETGKLPQFLFSAQATYQSDVIELPISGRESLNKDQYKATLSVNQLIFDSGTLNTAMKAKTANEKTQQKQVETSLHQLKLRVSQLYFSILLTQEKIHLLQSQKILLESKLKEIKSGIKNGMVLPSSDLVLSAELLKLQQKFTDLNTQKSSLLQTLASLIGKEIPAETSLQAPLTKANFQSRLQRSELELFQLKKEQIALSEQLVSKENSPKILGFANLGYGNPGLNMLENSFQPYYIVGLKINWNPFDWNATKLKKASLNIHQDLIQNEVEIFELNTKIELQQLEKEIEKTQQLMASDAEIILLRKSILQSVDAQLKNGLITTSNYLEAVTQLHEDEIFFQTLVIELLLKTESYNLLKGN